MSRLTECPKVGDRVRLPANYEGGSLWFARLAGQTGTVTRIHTDEWDVSVQFDDNVEDYGNWRALEPAGDASRIVELGGVRYRLVPVVPDEEETPPPPRVPKQGEVWRDRWGDLHLIAQTAPGVLQAIDLQDGNRFREAGCDPFVSEEFVFAYERVAAASAAGALK